MTIKEIVTEWLVAHKLDGLNSPFNDCACEISDLMPCIDPSQNCTAGRKVPCDGSRCEGKCDFHIEEANEATAPEAGKEEDDGAK